MEWELLGDDPSPGSVADIHDHADVLSRQASDIKEIHEDIQRLGFALVNAGVTGPVVEGFLDAFGHLPALLLEMMESYELAAAGLRNHADVLAESKVRSRSLLTQTEELESDGKDDAVRRTSKDVLARLRQQAVEVRQDVDSSAQQVIARLAGLGPTPGAVVSLARALDGASLPGVGSLRDMIAETSEEQHRAAEVLLSALQGFSVKVSVGDDN